MARLFRVVVSFWGVRLVFLLLCKVKEDYAAIALNWDGVVCNSPSL